jgi:thioredoxin-like negative regulator of GroEL
MSDKPAIGRNVYNQAINRGRHAQSTARQALRRILDEQPGPQTTALLLAKAALALGEIEAILNELDEIGRNAKRTSKQNLDN